MKKDMYQSLVETIVTKAIKDLRDSPERSLRNVVSTALTHTDGRFQQAFFAATQKILEDPNCPYYALLKDVAANVDSDRLLRFGMNLGYNSYTLGAHRIRSLEANLHYNIPWSIIFHLAVSDDTAGTDFCHSLIQQGNQLGIFTWLIYMSGHLETILPILRHFEDSAFILLCEPDSITPAFIDSILECSNLMIAVDYRPDAAQACQQLRQHKLFYALYHTYQKGEQELITSHDLFYDMEQLHPAFVALIPSADCSQLLHLRVSDVVTDLRLRNPLQLIPLELVSDFQKIDHIISGASCFAEFDEHGNLCLPSQPAHPLNLHQMSLSDILRTAFPQET